MKKIPTLFERDWDGDRSRVTDKLAVDITGSVATVKWDGTSVMVDGSGRLFKRRMVRKDKPSPHGFILCTLVEESGKAFGWVPVDPDKPENKVYWIDERPPIVPGTYEFCGPKINGNPLRLEYHLYRMHGQLPVFPMWPAERNPTYQEVEETLATLPHEGIVFWRRGAPVAKIKRTDMGFGWPL